MILAVALVRWAHLLPLLAIFGATALTSVLQWQGLPTSPRQAWIGRAAILALATALAQIVLTSATMAGNWQAGIDIETLRAVLQHTTFGQTAVWRLAVLVLLVATSLATNRFPFVPAVLSGFALFGVAVTSHAAALGDTAHASWRILNDAVHLLTAGFWIGSLIVVLGMARTVQPAALVRPLQVFSEIALYAVTALMLAGMLNTAFVYSAAHMGWTYTLLLLLKVVMAFSMLVYALLNRLRVMPALEQGQDDGRLGANVRRELLLSAGVVALAAILGSISPA